MFSQKLCRWISGSFHEMDALMYNSFMILKVALSTPFLAASQLLLLLSITLGSWSQCSLRSAWNWCVGGVGEHELEQGEPCTWPALSCGVSWLAAAHYKTSQVGLLLLCMSMSSALQVLWGRVECCLQGAIENTSNFVFRIFFSLSRCFWCLVPHNLV